MNLLKLKLKRFFKVTGSYIRAFFRLIIWTILVFFSGLQRTLFMRSEVAGVDIKITPLKCDIEDTNEKLSYIDKLCLENPELIETVESNKLQDEDFFDDTDEYNRGDEF